MQIRQFDLVKLQLFTWSVSVPAITLKIQKYRSDLTGSHKDSEKLLILFFTINSSNTINVVMPVTLIFVRIEKQVRWTFVFKLLSSQTAEEPGAHTWMDIELRFANTKCYKNNRYETCNFKSLQYYLKQVISMIKKFVLLKTTYNHLLLVQK